MTECPDCEPFPDRKWIYEDIVERIPPFRWLPPTWDVIAQLFLVEAVGIAAFFIFQMPFETVVIGSLIILYTVVWSAGCLYVIPWLRRLQNPTNVEELSVLRSYKRRLLLDRKYELGGGLAFFTGVMGYLFWDPSLLIHFLGPFYNNPFLLILIAILAWDVSYRMALSFITTLFAASRSIGLAVAARRRRGLEYTAYSEVRTLKFLDSVNLYWAASAILLFPVTFQSEIMFFGLLAFLGAILGLSLVSLMAMETVPWFPPDVESILHIERFAYVAACEKNQPHVTPVIFVYDGKYFYFAISLASQKYKIIRKNSKVAALVDMRDSKNPMNNRAIQIRGKATILGEVSAFGVVKLFLYGFWLLRARSLFAKKYPRYMKYYDDEAQELPLAWQNKPFISRVLVRLEPENITFWRRAKPVVLRA